PETVALGGLFTVLLLPSLKIRCHPATLAPAAGGAAHVWQSRTRLWRSPRWCTSGDIDRFLRGPRRRAAAKAQDEATDREGDNRVNRRSTSRRPGSRHDARNACSLEQQERCEDRDFPRRAALRSESR